MSLTRTSIIRLLRLSFAVLIGILIVTYAIIRSLNYARGPHIDIFEPVNGATVATTSVAIHGRVLRINKLTFNGSQISIDEKGNFYNVSIIFPGVNFLTFIGSDQFGRSVTTRLDLFGTQELPKTPVPPSTLNSSSSPRRNSNTTSSTTRD